MRSFPIDTTALRFLAASDLAPEIALETGKPKTNRTGEVVSAVEVLVQQEGRKSSVITVKIHGTNAKITEGTRVQFTELEAVPWENDNGHGISFRAANIASAATSGKAAA